MKTINNDALAEFIKNTFEISVENNLIDQTDWEWGMDSLEDLIGDAQNLRDELDEMSHEEKLQWLKDNNLGYWTEDDEDDGED